MSEAIEFLAVVTSAVYGVLLARKHGMDFVGVFCLAFIVAFGGGTLRDLLLDRHPLFWIQKSHYPPVVFGIALLTFVMRHLPHRVERFLSVPDALGLGLFSIAGATAALDSGTSWFIAALLGAVTGTFGGVIGDVICNRVPSLFRPAPMFATCSFVGVLVFLILHGSAVTRDLAPAIGILVIVGFRLAALRYDLRLPHFEEDSTSGE